MADPTTPNYGFELPTVGGDDNVWGGLLNGNWSSIDTILWTVSGVANAALTQGAGDARYLRLTGGSIGPNSFIVNGPAQFNNYAAFSGSQPTVFQTQAQFTGGATFGTAQVFFNSQVTFSADALAVTPAASDNSQRVATTAFVAGAIGALPAPPAPSSNLPLMNGTAAPGLLAPYSRGDHVHPSDTSRLALAGGALTGPLTLAADPTANLGAATKQYVDANFGHNSGFGGFVNKFRNATFDVWQRGTAVAVAAGGGVFTADGWLVVATGAATTVQQGANNRAGGSRNYLSILAASGLTGFNIRQRIESFIAAPLAGETCTFSCWMYNNMAASITPTLTVQHPTAENNFASTVADLPATNLQPVPPGAWTRVAYTWAQPQASQGLGLELVITFPANALNAASGGFILSDADVRATPGVATGLNANPPPPELRPIAIEVAYCQRYYTASGGAAGVFSGNVTSTFNYTAFYKLPVRMRVAPTVVLVNTNAVGFPATSGTLATNTDWFYENRTASATQTGFYSSSYTASAEL